MAKNLFVQEKAQTVNLNLIMKKKLNIANPLLNADLLEESILKQERKQQSHVNRQITDKQYYWNTDDCNIIRKTLRSNVGLSWNEVYKKIIRKIKLQNHYLIDCYVYRPNTNGDLVNSYGTIQRILNYTFRTSGSAGERQYYIKDGILECNQPYMRLSPKRKKKIISKKPIVVKKIYITKFDYDIIDTWSGGLDKFIKLLESNKKTYRVRRFQTVYDELPYNIRFVKPSERNASKQQLVITHIKTNYDKD